MRLETKVVDANGSDMSSVVNGHRGSGGGADDDSIVDGGMVGAGISPAQLLSRVRLFVQLPHGPGVKNLPADVGT